MKICREMNKLMLDVTKITFFFFFDKSEKYIKKHRGAQPLVHRGYTKGS
jgi:hypothetical protein